MDSELVSGTTEIQSNKEFKVICSQGTDKNKFSNSKEYFSKLTIFTKKSAMQETEKQPATTSKPIDIKLEYKYDPRDELEDDDDDIIFLS